MVKCRNFRKMKKMSWTEVSFQEDCEDCAISVYDLPSFDVHARL